MICIDIWIKIIKEIHIFILLFFIFNVNYISYFLWGMVDDIIMNLIACQSPVLFLSNKAKNIKFYIEFSFKL